MEWLHWVGEAFAFGCGALGLYKAKRATDSRSSDVELAAGVAAEQAVKVLEAKADEILRQFEGGGQLAGAVVLDRLSREREAAIATGKAAAVAEHLARRAPKRK